MQLLYAAKYVLKCAVWYQFRFLIIAKTDNQKLHFTCFWLFDSIIFAIDEI
jgi:hypothetical protein